MRNRYDFKFGDVWLSELGGVTKTPPSIEIAERDINFVDIPGRDGSDIIDNGRYKNVELSRNVAFVSKPQLNVDTKVELAINNFAYLQGYQNFEDTDHPGMFTKAAITNFNEINKDLRTMRSADIRFSRVPYWYRKDSFNEVVIGELGGGTTTYLRNPYKSDAKSIIKFQFSCPSGVTRTESLQFSIFGRSGIYRLFVEDISVTLSYPILLIDLEKQLVCQANSSGEIHHYYDYQIPSGIDPGESTFLVGENEHLLSAIIIPKWRCL